MEINICFNSHTRDHLDKVIHMGTTCLSGHGLYPGQVGVAFGKGTQHGDHLASRSQAHISFWFKY